MYQISTTNTYYRSDIDIPYTYYRPLRLVCAYTKTLPFSKSHHAIVLTPNYIHTNFHLSPICTKKLLTLQICTTKITHYMVNLSTQKLMSNIAPRHRYPLQYLQHSLHVATFRTYSISNLLRYLQEHRLHN